MVQYLSKLASRPGFPEEDSAAGSALRLSCAATVQFTAILFLFHCVFGSFGSFGAFGAFRFEKLVRQVCKVLCLC